MTSDPAQTLRDLAALALRDRLDGRAFPSAVGRIDGGPGPEVNRVLQLIRWRGENLTADGVASVLRGGALFLEDPLAGLRGTAGGGDDEPPAWALAGLA